MKLNQNTRSHEAGRLIRISRLGMQKNRAIFLDKDGTIVNNEEYPKIIPTDEILPETYNTLRKFQDIGYNYRLFIISSQPWIAKGRMTLEEVEEVFKSITRKYAREKITISGYGYCPHLRKDNCPDKKPSTRLFEKFILEYNLDTTRSYMVGDMDDDIQAGINMGLTTIRIQSKFPTKVRPDHTINNFSELEEIIQRYNFSYQ